MPSDHRTTAVAAARRRTRRAWRQWGVVVTLLALVLGTGIVRVWLKAEIRAVTVETTTIKPTALPAGQPDPSLATAWTSADTAAVGAPVQLDVVVTYSAHTVSGRDARTGAVRWSYSRSDRLVCSVAAQDGAVVAIYAHDGNCDEVTGLSAATGARTWSRTLFTNGSDITLTAIPGYVLIAAPGSLDLIEPTGGLDWWYDAQPAGCTTRAAVLGTGGVLIDSACASGDTLSFRNLTGSDNRLWSEPLAGRAVLAADGAVLALTADRRGVQRLQYNASSEKVTVAGVTTLNAVATAAADAHAQTFGDTGTSVEVATLADGAVAFDVGGTTVKWQRTGIGRPVAFGAALMAPSAGALLTIDPSTGSTTETVAVPGLTTASRLSVVGAYVLVGGGTSTTMLH